MLEINETHDINLNSWVSSANEHKDFPIQNLPFAIFRRKNTEQGWRGGVAIGDKILDLALISAANIFTGEAQQAAMAAAQPTLNDLMDLGKQSNSALRRALSKALTNGSALASHLHSMLVDQKDAEYNVPCTVGDFTDFYTSIYHATAVGKLFRPDNPLLPNYKWIPIGYHGRSSSIGVSGQKFPRPTGQIKSPNRTIPEFSPCKRLDYELEMGLFIGKGTKLGEVIHIDNAEDHLFGICLLNDWSARDLQAWEYQPLGPFLAKNFATTISPWIVTTEALAPFRHAFAHPEGDPEPLPYLNSTKNSASGSFNITLDCFLETQKMREEKTPMASLSRSNFKHSYWTAAQMISHHSSNGCAMQAGDLLGTGTQSGPEEQEAGSLLELSKGGKAAITLPNGETRTFLEDGDTVIMRASCAKKGAKTIGFGEVSGTILPPLSQPTSSQ